jgi:hypothetical protein
MAVAVAGSDGGDPRPLAPVPASATPRPTDQEGADAETSPHPAAKATTPAPAAADVATAPGADTTAAAALTDPIVRAYLREVRSAIGGGPMEALANMETAGDSSAADGPGGGVMPMVAGRSMTWGPTAADATPWMPTGADPALGIMLQRLAAAMGVGEVWPYRFESAYDVLTPDGSTPADAVVRASLLDLALEAELAAATVGPDLVQAVVAIDELEEALAGEAAGAMGRPSASPMPVPEPSSVLVFLAAASVLVLRRASRGRRCASSG